MNLRYTQHSKYVSVSKISLRIITKQKATINGEGPPKALKQNHHGMDEGMCRRRASPPSISAIHPNPSIQSISKSIAFISSNKLLLPHIDLTSDLVTVQLDVAQNRQMVAGRNWRRKCVVFGDQTMVRHWPNVLNAQRRVGPNVIQAAVEALGEARGTREVGVLGRTGQKLAFEGR